MKWLFAIFALLAIVFFMFGRRSPDVTQNEGDRRDGISTSVSRSGTPTPVPPPAITRPDEKTNGKKKNVLKNERGEITSSPLVSVNEHAGDEHGAPTRDYAVEDGVAVIEGDIVIGLPGTPGRPAQVPKITPWPTHEVPVYIQPSVSNPERIAQAITYFDPTVVRFVPYTNQRDVLVFENGEGRCKSYMGKIGGKQPIFLAADCGPHEIAHELMHALGFIHEQNRTDRDEAVRVNRDNILPTALTNFEKFPRDYMLLSGLSPFDFTSLMLYPPSMFSRNGDPTITSATGAPIEPSERLSAQDLARVNSFYGSR